jgi:O-antigen ligase
MRHNPVLGLGPGHWTLVAHEYGWPPGKEAHSLWMQMGAELGFPGVGFLAAFYMICIGRLWPLARRPAARGDPGLRIEAAMVVTSLIGFCISAQFVTVDTVEIPYYVCLVGAVVLKLASAPAINPLTILATTGPPFHQVHPALAGRLVSN